MQQLVVDDDCILESQQQESVTPTWATGHASQ